MIGLNAVLRSSFTHLGYRNKASCCKTTDTLYVSVQLDLTELDVPFECSAWRNIWNSIACFNCMHLFVLEDTVPQISTFYIPGELKSISASTTYQTLRQKTTSGVTSASQQQECEPEVDTESPKLRLGEKWHFVSPDPNITWLFIGLAKRLNLWNCKSRSETEPLNESLKAVPP